MKDTLKDLNDHLFAEIERLGDEDLKGDKLKNEIDRADAVSRVSAQIISNASLALRATQMKKEYGMSKNELPVFLEDKGK